MEVRIKNAKIMLDAMKEVMDVFSYEVAMEDYAEVSADAVKAMFFTAEEQLVEARKVFRSLRKYMTDTQYNEALTTFTKATKPKKERKAKPFKTKKDLEFIEVTSFLKSLGLPCTIANKNTILQGLFKNCKDGIRVRRDAAYAVAIRTGLLVV